MSSMRPYPRIAMLFVATAAAVATAIVVPTGTASASSADVTISQVYGGGGNSGAQYANDFIELYNHSSASVPVSTWSVQYASATGSSWSKTALTGSVAAGAHYLIKESATASGVKDFIGYGSAAGFDPFNDGIDF